MSQPNLADWIGNSETVSDSITATPYAALAATLDLPSERPAPGTPLPGLWHWLYFLPLHRQSLISEDGHAQRGGFMPPVPLPRRMWAGSQFVFHQLLRIGDQVARTSTIDNVTEKIGRSGPLTFVRVRHELRCNGSSNVALTEFHEIVYREAPKADDSVPTPQVAPKNFQWQRKIVPDDVLLFRYSALTFNGHRIHYDRKYVTQTEGYPGLVVHGPLIATLLIDLLREHRPDAVLERFEFRAVRPTFDINHFFVCGQSDTDGRTFHLWAQDHKGWLTMDATAVIR